MNAIIKTDKLCKSFSVGGKQIHIIKNLDFNTDGEFIGTNGDYFGLSGDARGVSALRFEENKYIIIQTYEEVQGLSITAYTMPVAEKINENTVPDDAINTWNARNDNEYLLVNEKYSSFFYIKSPIAKTLTDERMPGYVGQGLYKGGGVSISWAKITDSETAVGYQSIPTMAGRDANNLYVTTQNGVEYLNINNQSFINAASCEQFSTIDGNVVIGSETVWFDVDEGLGGKVVSITAPPNSSWFVYDDKMNCIATSLEKNIRETMVLPENGRLAFAGEAGAVFVVQ